MPSQHAIGRLRGPAITRARDNLILKDAKIPKVMVNPECRFIQTLLRPTVSFWETNLGGYFLCRRNVSYNRQQKAWCLRGTWQGQRLYFSEYHTAIGPNKPMQAFISNEMANGVFDPRRYKKTKPVHLKKYADAWLKRIEPTIEKGTYDPYRAAIKWIKKILGDVYLSDLNYNHYLKLWTDIERSKKYRKNILTTMYAMMEDARRAGDIKQVPEKIVFKRKFAIPKKLKEGVDRPTQEKIIDQIPERHRPIFRFLVITGVRPSEARALRKADICREREVIKIRKAFGRDGKVKDVKQKEEREIPLYQSLGDVFSAAQLSLSEYVFINPDTGTPYTKNINRDIFNPAAKRAGVSIKLNNFGRHSWGQQMADKGVDFNVISKGLGHSSVETTKASYADPSMRVLKTAVDEDRVVKFDRAKGD